MCFFHFLLSGFGHGFYFNDFPKQQRDHHHNWTSRKNQNGKVETRPSVIMTNRNEEQGRFFHPCSC